MACSNCYNGCTEIVSDKCVKYTGVDVPVLGIQNGDSLSYVEQALIEFLTSTLDGTGIKPFIDPEIICTLVQDNLPTCGDLTAVDLFNALIKSACSLQEQVDALVAKFAELEQGYSINCLSGSPDPTSTYEVLQATINKLCEVEEGLAFLALDVQTNYVRLDELNALIQAYLDSQSGGGGGSVQQYTKMVPYTVVEYYGTLANFDSTGAGLSNLGWDKIYLCNGQNGTPDKRGRSPIGSTSLQGGGALDPEVLPGATNPSYNGTGVKNGVNQVTLTEAQLPAHTHLASAISTTNIVPASHNHGWTGQAGDGYPDGSGDRTTAGSTNSYVRQTQQLNVTLNAVTTTNVTNLTTGLNQGHNNVHPVISCYYIMYIP